jgi:hypothetical protein
MATFYMHESYDLLEHLPLPKGQFFLLGRDMSNLLEML